MTKKKSKKKKTTIKDIVTSTKFLTIVFILLLILVVFLVIICSIKENNAKTDGFANMNFPILKEETSIEFSINAFTLSQTDEYIFKVTNFKDKKINKKKLDYTVTIENDTNSVISVTVNDVGEDVMVNQKSTVLNDSLKKDEKEAVFYHVKVISNGELDKKDLINIKINS